MVVVGRQVVLLTQEEVVAAYLLFLAQLLFPLFHPLAAAAAEQGLILLASTEAETVDQVAAHL
jgi:uncharacterized membrane protein